MGYKVKGQLQVTPQVEKTLSFHIITGKDKTKWLWQHKIKGIFKTLNVKVVGQHRGCGFSARPFHRTFFYLAFKVNEAKGNSYSHKTRA